MDRSETAGADFLRLDRRDVPRGGLAEGVATVAAVPRGWRRGPRPDRRR